MLSHIIANLPDKIVSEECTTIFSPSNLQSLIFFINFGQMPILAKIWPVLLAIKQPPLYKGLLFLRKFPFRKTFLVFSSGCDLGIFRISFLYSFSSSMFSSCVFTHRRLCFFSTCVFYQKQKAKKERKIIYPEREKLYGKIRE